MKKKGARFIAATCNRCNSYVWNDENHFCKVLKLYNRIDNLNKVLKKAVEALKKQAMGCETRYAIEALAEIEKILGEGK